MSAAGTVVCLICAVLLAGLVTVEALGFLNLWQGCSRRWHR